MSWLESDKEFTKRIQGYQEDIDYIPANRLYLNIDKQQVLDNMYVDEKYANRIVEKMDFNFNGKSYLGKHELMLLKLIEEGEWKRPLYFAVTVDPALMRSYQRYFIHEGLVYKIAPVNRCVDTDKMYDNLCNNFRWGNIQDSTVYLDENNLRMCRTQRQMFGTLIKALCQEGKFEKAEAAIARCEEIFPKDLFPVNFVDAGLSGYQEIIEAYYMMGKTQEARALIAEAFSTSEDCLNWVFSQREGLWASGLRLANNQLYVMQDLLSNMGSKDPELIKIYGDMFQQYARLYQSIR
jgi:pentatricopeptide repeat protein